jgi:signal peptidase I
MRRFVKDFLLPMAVAVALAFVIQAAVAKPYEIPTESMVPTIKANDRIIANRMIYRFRDIARRDIIVFQPPPSATRTCGDAGGGNIPFVKRVIGLPGDEVEVRREVVTAADGPVFANVRVIAPGASTITGGASVRIRLKPGDARSVTYVDGEPFVVAEAITPVELEGDPEGYGVSGQIMDTGTYEFEGRTVPADRLLVLGDNRPGSCDAHQWQPDPYVPMDNVIGQAEVVYWPLSHLAFLD